MQRETVDQLLICTNLSNCITAALQAKSGKKVLLIDKNSFFGDLYDSAFTLKDLLRNPPSGLEIQKSWSQQETEDIWIDISARPLLSTDPIIDSIIEAEISCEYLSMMEIKPIYYLYNERYYKLPLTKEDIFLDSSLSLFQKRSFMRILDQIRNSSEIDISTMDPLFKEMVLYGYCGFSSKTETLSIGNDFIKKSLDRFGSAIGRFTHRVDADGLCDEISSATSPFLFPRFSNFEIVQAFIRKSCVLGATVITSASLSNITELEKSKHEFSVIQDSQSHWLLASNWSLDAQTISKPLERENSVLCAALILPYSTNSFLPMPSKKDGVAFASTLFHDYRVCILNVGSASGSTIIGTVLLYIWVRGPYEILLSFIEEKMIIDIENDTLGGAIFKRPHTNIIHPSV